MKVSFFGSKIVKEALSIIKRGMLSDDQDALDIPDLAVRVFFHWYISFLNDYDAECMDELLAYHPWISLLVDIVTIDSLEKELTSLLLSSPVRIKRMRYNFVKDVLIIEIK